MTVKRFKWVTDIKEHDMPYQNIEIKEGKTTICALWIDDAPCQEFNAAQYKRAALITAAPDLLEALSNLTEMYCQMINSGDCGYWNPENVIEVKNARAAIAKATCKEP